MNRIKARPGLAELVEFGVELRPGTLRNPLERTQEMLVRLAIPVREKQVVLVCFLALPAIVDGVHEALADLDSTSLVVLAVEVQRRSQVTVAAPICLVVTRHCANEEVERESVLGIGVAVEHIQFVVRASDYLLLMVLRLLVLLEEHKTLQRRSSELQFKGKLDRSRTADLIERVESCIVAAGEAVRECLSGLAK
jgi:hypothetical protein